MANHVPFKERLRQAREETGLTIDLAAMTINANRDDWEKWESGTDVPSMREGLAICILLGITPHFLDKGD